MEDYFPAANWLRTYGQNKWCGHIFCCGDRQTRLDVANCAKEFFASHPEYEIRFNELAIDRAKIGSD